MRGSAPIDVKSPAILRASAFHHFPAGATALPTRGCSAIGMACSIPWSWVVDVAMGPIRQLGMNSMLTDASNMVTRLTLPANKQSRGIASRADAKRTTYNRPGRRRSPYPRDSWHVNSADPPLPTDTDPQNSQTNYLQHVIGLGRYPRTCRYAPKRTAWPHLM
jgi:hypothetical protein